MMITFRDISDRHELSWKVRLTIKITFMMKISLQLSFCRNVGVVGRRTGKVKLMIKKRVIKASVQLSFYRNIRCASSAGKLDSKIDDKKTHGKILLQLSFLS